MYRFKSATRLFTTTAFPTSTFSHSSALFGALASRRRHGGSVRRKILPPEFSRNVVRLTCESTAEGGLCEVYVIGTVHDYPKSVEDVKNLVNFVKPQSVFLELCSSRANILDPPEVSSEEEDIESEFRVAFQEANKFGAKVILGDRPDNITTIRYDDKFNGMMPWHAMKMVFSTLRRSPKKMPNLDDLYKRPFNLIDDNDEVYQKSPIYIEIIIDERDQYMSAGLLEVARVHNSVVAVVGKSHVLGIQKYWKQPVEVNQLLTVPLVSRYQVNLLALYCFSDLLNFLMLLSQRCTFPFP